MAKFPFFHQHDMMDCGPTCIRMIAAHYGQQYSLQYLREISYIDREGVSARGIVEAAERIGLQTLPVLLPLHADDESPGLVEDVPLPAIAHWKQQHFVVVYKITKKHVYLADPAEGKRKVPKSLFKKNWQSDGDKGIIIVTEPTPEFYEAEGVETPKTGFKFLFRYLRPYYNLIGQLFVGLLLGSLIQLIFPFLTQAVVDIGIQNQDINFIYLILGAQLMLFLSQMAATFIQNWILLHMSTRINVNLISDFLTKIMRLPVGYFDTKMIGDLLQRIGDHKRIELFLTNSTLNIIFSTFNIIVFSIVLAIYSWTIFWIFIIGSILYVLWITIFLKKRAEIDYQKFTHNADNQSELIELIQGMQEIKLQNSEFKHRWKWMSIQAKLFRANIRSLQITQYQDVGAGFINQLKDILITFVAATAVIQGSITLGMMLAIQYIIGQMNGPLQQMVLFLRTAQDAQLSLERLGEIHSKDNEEEDLESKTDLLPANRDIYIENLSFRYNQLSDDVLENINLTIPEGKVTAIVGTSGSGKTTLVKLLLGFYEPTAGNIRIGGIHLKNLVKKMWRSKCGAVMQDGYIFSDTIAKNIAESADTVDKQKLLQAVQTANIQQFIEKMPLGYNTKIGRKGNGLSQGQKQRLLIARAVYKNPDFLFFDEATNALDAKNEKIIMENMDRFFAGRTVLVVAHRLSTVKNADQIVVLERGKLIEKGTHMDLVAQRGAYFNLVKNQLELGS